MKKSGFTGFMNAMYALNIISQAIFSLATPIGIGVLASYLLVEFAAAPSWIYAPLTVLGALSGLYSMIKFILSATAGLERLEKEQTQRGKENERNKNDK